MLGDSDVTGHLPVGCHRAIKNMHNLELACANILVSTQNGTGIAAELHASAQAFNVSEKRQMDSQPSNSYNLLGFTLQYMHFTSLKISIKPYKIPKPM